jgi:hypothetical protein
MKMDRGTWWVAHWGVAVYKADLGPPNPIIFTVRLKQVVSGSVTESVNKLRHRLFAGSFFGKLSGANLN